jgi:hypothetical protein
MREGKPDRVGRRGLAACAALALTVVGCGGNDRPSVGPRVAVTGPFASCERPSPIGSGPNDSGPEVTGRGAGAQLHGLIMARRVPLVAGPHDVKVVWRMTGRGPLRLAAYDSQGRRVPLVWGPEYHGGSTYHRPGKEWGGGYRFRRPGCYRLTAQRTVGRAEVWLRVGRAPAG